MDNEKYIDKLEKKLKNVQDKLSILNEKEELNFIDEHKKTHYLKKVKYLNELIDIYKNNFKDEARVKKGLLKERNKRQEILYGNLFTTIIAVIFPIAIYNFFNSFYNLIDSMMCSNISASAVNNVAILAQVKNTFYAFGAGIAGGGAVIVSRYYGAGKIDEAKKASGNILVISIILSLILCLIMVPMGGFILDLVDVSPLNNSILYFQLQMVELAIVAINTAFIGLEKVKGNSKKIFYLNLIVLAIKLVLNAIFIYQMNVTSIVWIEISTIVAQLSLFVVAICTFFSRKNTLRINIKHLIPQKRYILPIIMLSIPIFCGKFVMNLGKVIVNKMSSTYYNAVTDGLIAGALAVSNNLCGLITSPTNAFEEGESTIVSQNIGNRNLKRTIECFIKSTIVVMTISITGYILVRFVFVDQLINLFNTNKGSSEGELVMYIKDVFKYDSLSIISLGFTSAVLGLLYGYGKTFLSTILNFSRIGVRILSLFILHQMGVGYEACGLAMGISNITIGVLALLALLIFLFTYNKQKDKAFKMIEEKQKKKLSKA